MTPSAVQRLHATCPCQFVQAAPMTASLVRCQPLRHASHSLSYNLTADHHLNTRLANLIAVAPPSLAQRNRRFLGSLLPPHFPRFSINPLLLSIFSNSPFGIPPQLVSLLLTVVLTHASTCTQTDRNKRACARGAQKNRKGEKGSSIPFKNRKT